MCSIVIGTSTDDVRELVNLNKSRGSHSYSVFYIHKYSYAPLLQEKGLGELDADVIEIPEGYFAIIHQQAPTTQAKSIDSVHPSSFGGEHLWHNGILKAETCNQIRKALQVDDVWDTKLFHRVILDDERRFEINDIDGSFACVVYSEDEGIYIFRNEISPFYTDGSSFSSTRFDGSKPLTPNLVYRLEFLNLSDGVELTPVDQFKTKTNPYYFGE